jgi:hypothetical protein
MVYKKITAIAIALILLFNLHGFASPMPALKRDLRYGVFVGASSEKINTIKKYKTVVIDAEYFSKEQISRLTDNGQAVYSYLNIGSVEDFREYYNHFKSLTLGEYEDWPGERWVDVSAKPWQDFICGELVKDLADKGIAGFFIDNLDVYYNYPKEEIYKGALEILSRLAGYGLKITVNGGDTFVKEAIARGDLESTGITGVNQECVYTAIDFETGTFHRQSKEDTAYFTEYLSTCKENGLAIYTTEYAKRADRALRKEIAAFSAKNGYVCYIAPSLALDSEY